MGERDYFLVLFLMFVNLLLTNFFTFSSQLFVFELIIICILLVLNILFIFSRDRQGFAYIFFGLSIINNLYLFFTLLAFLPILLVIINVVILFYMYAISDVERLVRMREGIQPGAETKADFHGVEDVWEGTRAQERQENIFSSLNLDDLKDIDQRDPRSFVSEPGVQYWEDIDAAKEKPEELFVEKRQGQDWGIMTEHEFMESEEMKQMREYKHIEELGLPEAMEKPLPPDKRFTYQIYYEDPKLTLEFKPIEHLEKKIERKQAAEQLRRKRVRELLREEKRRGMAKPSALKKKAKQSSRQRKKRA